MECQTPKVIPNDFNDAVSINTEAASNAVWNMLLNIKLLLLFLRLFISLWNILIDTDC